MQLLVPILLSDWQINNRLLRDTDLSSRIQHFRDQSIHGIITTPDLCPNLSISQSKSRSPRQLCAHLLLQPSNGLQQANDAPLNGHPFPHRARPCLFLSSNLCWGSDHPHSDNFPAHQWLQRRLYEGLQHPPRRLLQFGLCRAGLLRQMHRLPR